MEEVHCCDYEWCQFGFLGVCTVLSVDSRLFREIELIVWVEVAAAETDTRLGGSVGAGMGADIRGRKI
jgi:hypothetical protein